MADELGSVWTSEPLRISQSIKSVGKEMDRGQDEQAEHQSPPEREEDRVELSSETEPGDVQNVTVRQHPDDHEVVEIAGRNIDVTVG